MHAEDATTETFERRTRSRRMWRWLWTSPPDRETANTRDLRLELSSLDMTVRFFDDRLDFYRRLGSAHGTISYRDIHVARLIDAATLFEQRTSTHDGTSQVHAKKMVLTLATETKPLTFDFRSEPGAKVREALALIEHGHAD